MSSLDRRLSRLHVKTFFGSNVRNLLGRQARRYHNHHDKRKSMELTRKPTSPWYIANLTVSPIPFLTAVKRRV